mmetsp:Transcript_34985/g.76567  ORF Transcript_34985/g.76567 Transcript_34985/m.76567 type:complete len:243 (-) Transcript_34985:73-801(-)
MVQPSRVVARVGQVNTTTTLGVGLIHQEIPRDAVCGLADLAGVIGSHPGGLLGKRCGASHRKILAGNCHAKGRREDFFDLGSSAAIPSLGPGLPCDVPPQIHADERHLHVDAHKSCAHLVQRRLNRVLGAGGKIVFRCQHLFHQRGENIVAGVVREQEPRWGDSAGRAQHLRDCLPRCRLRIYQLRFQLSLGCQYLAGRGLCGRGRNDLHRGYPGLAVVEFQLVLGGQDLPQESHDAHDSVD